MTDTNNETKRRGPSKVVIAIIVVVLVLAAIAVAYLLKTQAKAPSNVTVLDYTPAPATTNTHEPTAEEKALNENYASAVRQVIATGTLPDGTTITDDPEFATGEHLFGVADVDQDGTNELVVIWNQTGDDNTIGTVLQYNPAVNIWTVELNEAPMMIFYNTGYCKVLSKTNDSDGSIQPYYMYKYNASTDTYALEHTVTSWTRSKKPEGFPTDLDTNNVGTVFCVDGTWIGQPEWTNLNNEWMPSGSAILFEYYPMTMENAAKLVQ